MKKSSLIALVLVVAFAGSAFAGAPSPVMEKPVPVEQYTPAVAPVAPDAGTAKPLIISKHATWGLGLGGNPMIGFVEKDQFGYPRTEYTGFAYGINWALGFGVTTYAGYPSAEEINNAVSAIKASNPKVSDAELPSLVREKIGKNPFTYTHFGTAALVLPVNAEIGLQWIINDSCRTRLGIGIPTILCFGINWDF